ncbi:MAG: lipoyl(octanoyl) transferase LipB [Gammaproteobacteria bacterium]|nr:lipoyl(octanoyl) transferase LipB [Gammaproteobacteria bacterium]
MSEQPLIHIKALGQVEYAPTWKAMRQFTDERDKATPDEIWWLEHPPVFTLGQAGRIEHVLAPGDIPVVKTDRGGQVTYHGPGQVVIYPLLQLKRYGLGARGYVTLLEQTVVNWLAGQGIAAAPRADAPGVYVDSAKIAALGLRIRRGCSYHGLAINVDMNLEPFTRINPCGYPDMAVTDLAALNVSKTPEQAATELVSMLYAALSFASNAANRSGVPTSDQAP